MALHYDLTAVKNAFDAEGNIKPLTDKMIWFTMFVNMREITMENAEEFFTRLQLSLRLGLCTQADEITLQDIKDHIGLKTNVTEKTWSQFVKKEMKMFCANKPWHPGKRKKNSKAA